MTRAFELTVVECPPYLSTRWLRSHLTPISGNRDVVLNLQKCVAIRHLAQSWIIGQCAAWQIDGGPFLRIQLPRNLQARAMFTESGFLRVLAKITERNIDDLILDDTVSQGNKISGLTWRIRVPMKDEPSNFIFPFYLYDASYIRFHPAAVIRETKKWREPYLLEVLQSVLGDGTEQISTHIVQEAALMAIQRPNTSLLATSAALSHDNLTLTIWDNGATEMSEFETFLGPSQRTVSHIEEFGAQMAVEIAMQGFTPGDYQPPEIRSGRRSPGNPTAFGESDLTATNAAHDWARRLARNTYFRSIASVALDVFHGELIFLSGSVAGTLRKDPSDDGAPSHYSVSIVRYPDTTSFTGNIVSVRLPFRKNG